MRGKSRRGLGTRTQAEAAIAGLQEGLLLADPQGNIVNVNQAGLRLCGWRTRTSALRNIKEFKELQFRCVNGPVVPVNECPLSRVMRGETFSDWELVVTQANTGRAWVASWSGTPIRNEAGEIVLSLLTFRDVTDHYEEDQRFRVSERQMREALESADVGIWNWDVCKSEFAWSEKCRALYGLPAGTPMSRSVFLGAIHPEDRARVERTISRTMEQGVLIDEEFRILWPDGTTHWICLRGAAEVDPLGIATRMQGVMTSVNAHKLTETELRENAERSRRLRFEGIGVLAAGMAHDFNNLLTTIMGSASLLGHSLEQHAEAHRLIGEILSSTDKAANLTRQLLAYAGKGHIWLQRLNLSAEARDTVDLLRGSIPGGISIRLELGDGLPEVEGDRDQIRHVLSGLIMNGVEAIGERPGWVHVVTGVEDAARAFVEVSDNGCGMDKETVARIFDPFFSTKFLGRGLGLAAAQGIVRRHKGVIRVASAPGKGSSFRVLLPIAQGASAIS